MEIPKILVINCGSSSVRFQLIDMKNEEVLAKGKCDKIKLDGGFIEYECSNTNAKVHELIKMEDHSAAICLIIEKLIDPVVGALKSIDEIGATGHRIVHGGENFSESVLVNEFVISEIERCIDLAPLHNPGHIMGIKACQKILPCVPMVTVFDTAFHQTMPREHYLYALPYKYYEKYKVRKYGFHGTSHRYVTKRASEILNIEESKLSIVSCHIGNGASVCAIQNGKSIDTSMGLTPLEGLIMGTRTGDMDPAVAKFIMDHDNMSIDQYNEMINKESGLLGISGTTSDARELMELIDNGDKMAELAIDMQAYRLKKYIGSYVAALGKVDAIVFEGGIGENQPRIITKAMENLENLGIIMDQTKRNYKCAEQYISDESSKIKVLVIPTNEELMIARDTLKLVSK